MTDYREYHAYQWNIGDIGEGYTNEDIWELQALIDEELARIHDAHCSIRVVGEKDYNSNQGIQFNNDEEISEAIESAYDRFIALAGQYNA
jgi:hypothetical protein